MRTRVDINKVFGVRIEREDGTCFLAMSGSAAPMLFWKRSQAVKYRRELKGHGFKRTAVISVTMIFKYQPKPK